MLNRIPFGKYKNRIITSMTSVEETRYLFWLIQSKYCNPRLKISIERHLKC